ncbi:MAG: hypothetical protein AABZ57_04605, partial [Candidatus Margulisiibacteriota bacterium]
TAFLGLDFTGFFLAIAFLLAIVISISGSLVPGVVILVCAGILFWQYLVQKREHSGSFSLILNKTIRSFPLSLVVLMAFACACSVYSLYAGTFNANNDYGAQLPLWERYAPMASSLFNMFTQKLGVPLLYGSIILNLILIKRLFGDVYRKKFAPIVSTLVLFSLIYIILLPFGGYRMYRPCVLRYDTVMPVTIAGFFLFAASSVFLLKNLAKGQVRSYFLLLLFLAFAFSNADRIENSEYQCERRSMEQIASSRERLVRLENACSVMSWDTIKDPRYSELNAGLLRYWGVSSKTKLYYTP